MIEIIGETTADKIHGISCHYTKKQQWLKAIEEVGELAEELDNATNPFGDDNMVYLTANTWDLCADVIIMIAQLAMQHNEEETIQKRILYKVDRQLKRIKEET